MPDDINALDVRIVENTGADEFVLKTETVDRNIGNNLVTDSILATAGAITGKKVNLDTENYTLSGVIQDSDANTYPTLKTVDSYNNAVEKEINLAEATRFWGPTPDGFDVLHWGPREIEGMISKLATTEDATGSRGAGKFTFTLEWTHASIYVGD